MQNPILGIGPNNWRLVAQNYGFVPGKDAHTLWLHVGAEMGIPGLLALISFYGLSVARLWRLPRETTWVPEAWFRNPARMVIAAIVRFAVAAQFVRVYRVELPFHFV